MSRYPIRGVFSFINVIVVLALFANGIDHWVKIPRGYYGFLVSTSYSFGLCACLMGLFLFSLEFKSLDGFYRKHALFLMNPMGRGLAYIPISLLTSGVVWYQIISLLLIVAFGLSSIFIYYYAPGLLFTGFIPAFSQQRDDKGKVEKYVDDTFQAPLTEVVAIDEPHD